MAFELVKPGKLRPMSGLGEGEVSVQRVGTVTMRPSDLAEVGITDRVAVLADQENLRIAFRRPADGEESFAVRMPKNKKPERSQFCIMPALRTIGVDPAGVAGRYELTTKDNLLILTLTDASSKDKALKPPAAGAKK